MYDEEAREVAAQDMAHDICLSAGAGSGKTTVLIDRLIHLLTEGGVDLRQIVAITFTEKAAADLKTRLAGALRGRNGGDASGERPWKYDLAQARIGTIHGFCGQLLRENAVEAGVDPLFGVLDEVHRDALCRRTMDAWVDEMLSAALEGAGFLAPLLEHLDLRSVRGMLQDLIAEPLQTGALLDLYARGGEPDASPEHGLVRRALLSAMEDLMARWRGVLQEQGRVDFDGLLGRARDLLLDRPQVRDHYRRQFRYVHIDEFQDVDGVQADLVRLLCGFGEDECEGYPRLFVVGDPQQSIYRFRGADVDQFRRMESAILGRGGLSLRLTRCFRSQARLVGFYNHAFSRLFVPPEGLPGGRHVAYSALTSVRPEGASDPAVEFLFSPTVETAPEARAMEADVLARRLKQMLMDGELPVGERRDDGTEVCRAVRAGDIAVLFRAMTDVRAYEEALRRYGIPFYTVAGSGFFERQEVLDVLAALGLLTRPHDRLLLTAVLRSPWVGCSDATLFWIASEGAWDDLREERLRRKIDPEEAGCLDAFLGWFEDLLACRDRLPIVEIIAALLDRTLYRASLSVQPDGRQALANLRKLLDLARQFDAGPELTIHDFVAHLEERRAHTPREAQSALEVEEGNTVKLMSIHQAKGLEWPVVAVADLDRQFRRPEGDFLKDPTVGIGMKLRDERMEMVPGADYERVKAALVQLEVAEQQRIFYVAATRARDRLLLSGSFNPDRLKPAVAGTHSWMQWMGAVYPVGGEAAAYSWDGREMPIRVQPPAELEAQSAARGMTYPELVRTLEAASGAAPGRWSARLAPPPREGAVGRVAVTELELFALCPRRYQLSRLLRFPEWGDRVDGFEADVEDADPTPALTVGTLVHDVLRELPEDEKPAGLPALVHSVAQDQSRGDGAVDTGLEKAAVRLLERWLASDRWEAVRHSRERHSEVPFALRLDGQMRLTGRFDLLYRDAAGLWHVLDYKTDRLDGPASERMKYTYETQQRSYGLAASHLLGETAAGVVFVFLRSGEEVAWRPTPSAVAGAEGALRDSLALWGAALKSGAFPKTEDTERCLRCGYQSVCGRLKAES